MNERRFGEYDLRTQKYLDGILEEIHYIKDECDEDCIEDIKKDAIYEGELSKHPNKSPFGRDLRLYFLGNGEYVIEKIQSYGDDYCVVKVYFDRKPNYDSFDTWDLVFRTKGLLLDAKGTEFTCYKCGKKRHWLDVAGDLSDRINALMDEDCGCEI